MNMDAQEFTLAIHERLQAMRSEIEKRARIIARSASVAGVSAEDLVQDLFVQLTRPRLAVALRDFETKQFLAYCDRAMINRWIDQVRQAQFLKLKPITIRESSHSEGTNERIQLKSVLAGLEAVLKPDEFALLVMRYVQGKSIEEIARNTGRTYDAIAQAISRSIRKYRRTLDQATLRQNDQSEP